MEVLHEGFITELNKYLLAEVNQTIKAVTHLWEKYFVSLDALLTDRKKAEDKLNSFLKGLGYYE